MFNFKSIIKSEKTIECKVFVDSEPFKINNSYIYAKLLVISNKNGQVDIENCQIHNLKQTEFVEIEKYAINFNENFVQINSQRKHTFIKNLINVKLYNIPEEDLNIPELTEYLSSLGAKRNPNSEKETLFFKLEKFTNIDLKPFFAEFTKKKGRREEEDINFINEENLKRVSDFRIGSAKKFKDEFGNENLVDIPQRYEDNINYRFLQLQQEKKTEDIFDFSKEKFIPFEDDENFNFEYVENFHLNPYRLEQKQKIKKYSKSLHIYGFKPSFNQQGEFITLGKFNINTHTYNLNINKITPNKNLISENQIPKLLQKSEIFFKQYEDKANKMSIDENSIKSDNSSFPKKKDRELKEQINYQNVILEEYLSSTILKFSEIINKKISDHKDREEISGRINSKNINLYSGRMEVENEDDFVPKYIFLQKKFSDIKFSSYINKFKIDSCFDVMYYSEITDEYINSLINSLERFKKTFKFDDKNEIVRNLEKEISSLQLFSSLFLNCFPEMNNKLSQKLANKTISLIPENFSKSFLLKTQRLRKKKFIDWLIYEFLNAKEIDNQLAKFEKKPNNLENSTNQNNLYKFIFICLINGRFKKALELCNKFKFYNLSGLISQFFINNSIDTLKIFKEQFLKEICGKQDKYLNFIYEILTVNSSNLKKTIDISEKKQQNKDGKDFMINNQTNFSFQSLKDAQNPQISSNNQNNSYFQSSDQLGNKKYNKNFPNKENNVQNPLYYNEEILKELNWKQFFTINSLYCMKTTSKIDDLVENYDVNLSIYGKKYTNINSFLNMENCEDINMILLQYYYKIQRGVDYNEEFLNKIFLQKNIFTKFSDLHFHFIICTILLNTLTETYFDHKDKNLYLDLQILKKIQFKVLNRLVEDLLIMGKIWAGINLILISNLQDYQKINMIDLIIYRFIPCDHKDQLSKTFERICSRSTFDALAIRNMSLFDVEKAIKYFEFSENYEKLHDVFIHYVANTSIIKGIFNNENDRLINLLESQKSLIPGYRSNGEIFYKFINYSKKKESRLGRNEFYELENLMSDIMLNLKGKEGMKHVMNHTKNVMLLKMREYHNELLRDYNSRKDRNDNSYVFISSPNVDLIRNEEISDDLKFAEYLNTLKFLLENESNFINN